MEVGDGVPIGLGGADKLDGAVGIGQQVEADVRGEVGEAEARVEDLLAPAPLVVTGGHWDGGAAAVLVDVVLAEAHGDEGIGQLVAADEHAHLLAQGVAHEIPLDLHAGLLSEVHQHGVGVIAAGQGGHAAHDEELLLILFGVGLGVLAAAGCKAQDHEAAEQQGHNTLSHLLFLLYIVDWVRS